MLRMKMDDSFAGRIMGNYEAFEAKLDPAALLFLAVSPPELFAFAPAVGAGSRSLTINNKFYAELSVINRLSEIFTRLEKGSVIYKDIVYAEQSLGKLGVKNIKEFISSIKELLKDERRFKELKVLYKENSEELKYYLDKYISKELHKSKEAYESREAYESKEAYESREAYE